MFFQNKLNEIQKFEGLHDKGTCYIFGDGPSIKWFDLSNFRDHPAICCNNFLFHKDFSELDVKYYAIVPPWLFCPWWMKRNKTIINLQSIANEYRKVIKERQDIQFFVHLSNIITLNFKNVNFLYKSLPLKCKQSAGDDFSAINPCSGALQATLALAHYFGFSKIYLIGFDGWTIQPARALHWYELGKGEFFEPTNFGANFLNVFQREADIYTISADGQSCNVKNISYESYTGKPPVFKENHELLSAHNLNVLATYPGYKIFPDK
jgi:hypothetical protein